MDMPELIVGNGGSDPHFADMLGSLALTVQGFLVSRDVGSNSGKGFERESGRSGYVKYPSDQPT
jgi:hypothetical protein